MGSSSLDAETTAKILRQVEFYFSDSNLPGDKFLLKCIEESEDGLVSLPLVCSFSRMRSHLGLKEHGPDKVPAETTAAVAEVLRRSTSLRLSDDGSKVGRVEKLKSPEEVQVEVNNRSLAVNPFPWNVTIDEVESFFKEHIKVNSVRLPRLAGVKAFSGYAIVEFASEEEAEKVKGMKLTFQGAELQMEPKKAFEERQEAEVQLNGLRNGRAKNNGTTGRAGEAEEEEDDYPKGTVISFSLKKARASSPEVANGESAKEANAGEEAEKEEKEKGEKDADPESQVSREDIKETLKGFGKINFVDFSRGDTAGFVRFELPEEAQKARAAAVLAPEGGLVIKEHIAVLNAVEGEAEKEYWKKLREGQGKKRESGGRGFHDNRRGGRGGRFGRGRSGGRGKRDRDDRNGDGQNFQGKHKRFEDNQDGNERKVLKTD